MNNIFILLFSLLLFLTGCQDKDSGRQDISSMPPLGSKEKVTITEYLPKDYIAQSSYIKIKFSSMMQASTFNTSNVKLRNISDNILENIIINSTQNSLLIMPSTSLVPEKNYLLEINSTPIDILGNTLDKDYSLSFTCKEDFWDVVDAGESHSIAISKYGDLYLWGSDSETKIINEDAYIYTIPFGISNIGDSFKDLSAGSFDSAAIRSDATYYNIGKYSIVNSDNNFEKVSLGNNHNVIIKEDGTLWSWGKNNSGQLGNAGIFEQLNPFQENTQATDWSDVSAGEDYTVALKSDGTMWGWGDNEYHQIGNSHYKERRIPVQEDTNATDWEYLSAGANHSVAIKQDGTLWSWGYNSSGELGDATDNQSSTPTQEDTNATDWLKVSAGFNHTVAIKEDGTLWSWGNNYYGQLGDSSTDDKNIPNQIGNDDDWSSISSGKHFTLATKTNGTLWSWGYGANGQLGLGIDKDDILMPTEIK